MVYYQQATEIAVQEWQKAWAGKQATASVLDSGVPVRLSDRSQEEIAVLDLSGKAQLFGSAAMVGSPDGSIRNIQTSADGHYLSFLKQVVSLPPESAKPPNPPERLGFRSRFRLVITSIERLHDDSEVKEVFVEPGSLSWSFDQSDVYAFIGAP